MDQADALKRLADAADLLGMLEHLIDGLSHVSRSVGEVPWGGMSLTVKQAREDIESAYRDLVESLYREDAPVSDARVVPPTNGPRSAIAGRVQRVPASGSSRVRELLGSPAGRQVAGDRPSGEGPTDG